MNTKNIRRVRGTILVVTLVLLGVGALGVTAGVAILHARVGQVGAIEDASVRRVTFENSRAVAREHMYSSVLAGGAGTGQSISLPNSWGGVDMPSWTGNPMQSMTIGSYNNHFGPRVDGMYESQFAVGVGDGITSIPKSYRVLSNYPILMGDIFTLHRPAITPGDLIRVRGNIDVYGRAVLWADLNSSYPGDYDDLNAVQYVRPDDGATPYDVDAPGSGANVMPDNYPMLASTYGVVGASPSYDGKLNVVDPGVANPDNSLMLKAQANSPIYVDGSSYRPWSGGVHCNGNGRVYIELDTASLSSVIVSNVFRIYLYGQSNAVEEAAAGAMNPIMIVHTRNSGAERALYSIRCFDANNRKLVMGVKKNVENVETRMYFYDSFANPTWRTMMFAENTQLRTINLWGGEVNFKGGLHTDSSLRHTGWYSYAGVFNIVPEDEPELFIPLLVRNAWLEGVAQ
ncbi:MAG: hypothetical protein AAF591_10215 [Verrucomicrobiota bacterium]